VNWHQLRPLPPLPPGVWIPRPAFALPFPLDQPSCRIYQRARHALHRGVQALGLQPGDEVLAPAYHHGSEIQALVEAGLECRFYDTGERLAPDRAALEALVGPRTRALHLIHYLGFPQDAASWRAWCDERGLLLIEDAAQAWLSCWQGRPVGSYGDLAIFCAYKSFGVPDGGLMVARSGSRPAQPAGPRDLGLLTVLGRNAKWLWQRVPHADGPRSQPKPAAPYDPAADFALGDPDSRAAVATVVLLPRFGWKLARLRRRRNYEYLLNRLPETVAPVFPELPDGAVPFALPVRTSDKHVLLEHLSCCGITAFDLWSVPHPTLPASDFPQAASLRASVVALPVHQELRRIDLDQMVAAVRTVAGGMRM
jgi:dTDP-4-amino-4,6-dideoxygalactose transaminase